MQGKNVLRWSVACLSVLILYAVTGINGTRYHQQANRSEAQWKYDRTQRKLDENMSSMSPEERAIYLQNQTALYAFGPEAWVDYSFPVLPGVLLIRSGYQIGALNGGGGDKLLLYYGLGALCICEFNTWKS